MMEDSRKLSTEYHGTCIPPPPHTLNKCFEYLKHTLIRAKLMKEGFILAHSTVRHGGDVRESGPGSS